MIGLRAWRRVVVGLPVPLLTARRAERLAVGTTRKSAPLPGGIRDDLEPRHQRTHLGIVPALAVKLREPERAVDQRDRGEKIEAVVGGLARGRLDPAGIVLLPPQARGVGDQQLEAGEV